MNPDKAIELLHLLLEDSPYIPNPDTKGAIKLGIEYLKLYKHCHEIGCDMAEDLLPGETKD